MIATYSRDWFGHISECFISMIYITWFICRLMERNVLGLSYAYMALTIGKSLIFPMLLSHVTAPTLITSTID